MLKLKDMAGYAKFPKFTIWDRDIWKFIRRHSRLIDRLDSRKMVEMTQWGFTMLQDQTKWGMQKRHTKWQFYGKRGFFRNMD